MQNVIEKNGAGNLVLTGKAAIGLDNGYTNKDMGDHEFTMEFFLHDLANEKDGSGSIEWDVPTLGEVVNIGVWWENGVLQDYDGVFELPEQAIELLEFYGLDCTEFKD